MAPTIKVDILGDSSSLERSFRRSSASARGFERNIGQAGRGAVAGSRVMGGLGRSIAFASGAFLGTAGLVTAARSAFEEMSQSAKVTAQTNAVLKSTGGVANVTAGHVDELGKALLAKSGVDDETIRSGENMLLTFRQIRNEAGQGNAIFDQAARAVLNMDVAMSHGNVTQESLAKKAILVGKALNDPIKGLTSLRRVGVAFSEQQIKQITAFTKSGDIMKAQKIILNELNAEFGGSAAALGQTLPGKIAIARESFRNLGGQLATQLVPAITRITDRFNRWISNTQNQVRVQRTFHQIIQGITGALRILQSVMSGVNRVTGGTTNTVKLLLGAFVAFKAAKFAGSIAAIGRNLGSVDTKAGGATGKIAALRGRLIRLVANPYVATISIVAVGAEIVARKIKGLQEQVIEAEGHTFKKGEGVETSLVPTLARRINELKKAGQSTKNIIATLRKEFDNAGIGDDLIAEALHLSNAPSSDPLSKRINKQVTERVAKAAKATTDTFKKATRAAAASTKKDVGKSAADLAAQQNEFFDARISRSVNRVQDIAGETGQIAALQAIAAKITARIAATKDVTRKLNLEDQLLDIVRQQRDLRAQKAAADQAAAEEAKQKRADQAAAFLDSLQFGFEKAQATAGIGDDLKALDAIEKELRKRIKAEGRTTDLQRQLFEVGQQRLDVKKQAAQDRADAREKERQRAKDKREREAAARAARDFRALGLGATGEAITPGVENLRKRLGNISQTVKGTFLDTNKTRTMLAGIRKALTDSLAPPEVRSKVKEMLDGVNDELRNHTGEQTKFAHVSSANFVKSLNLKNLTRDQKRVIQAGFTQIGAGNTAPGGRSGQFTGVRGGGIHVTMHNPQFHGVQDIRALENQLDKRARSRPQVRRGAR